MKYFYKYKRINLFVNMTKVMFLDRPDILMLNKKRLYLFENQITK